MEKRYRESGRAGRRLPGPERSRQPTRGVGQCGRSSVRGGPRPAASPSGPRSAHIHNEPCHACPADSRTRTDLRLRGSGSPTTPSTEHSVSPHARPPDSQTLDFMQKSGDTAAARTAAHSAYSHSQRKCQVPVRIIRGVMATTTIARHCYKILLSVTSKQRVASGGISGPAPFLP